MERDPRRPFVRRDGLVLKNRNGVAADGVFWWCVACHGKRGRSRHRLMDSLDAVYVVWDVHKATGEHLSNQRTRDIIRSVDAATPRHHPNGSDDGAL
jgi:mono/diheme cytochrome c family protein